MQQFNIAQAQTRLSQLVKRALDGEEVIIAKNNKPLVRLVPLTRTAPRRRPGSAKGMVLMSKSFGAPLDDMRQYG